MNPLPMIIATIRRHLWTYLLFTLVVAIATGIGVAITSQEAALRKGSARAADKFDLIIAAPGSQTDVVLEAIYLRPGTVPLLDPAMTAQALNDQRAKIASPIGFGDSIKGSPIAGTTPDFATYLSGNWAQGRVFQSETEAVIGSAVRLKMGDKFRPSHGMAHTGHDADDDHDEEQHNVDLQVVGRMNPTGTPWDNAVIVPIELIWRVHGLPTGHAPDSKQIGRPYDPARVPGVPAIVMHPDSINAAYGLRNVYRTPVSMAFFPAEVLVKLYDVLGDVRTIMNWLAIATQGLVVLSMLAGVVAILSLHRRQFAVLRALGAPKAYIFFCVWGQVVFIAVLGALLGLLLGSGIAIIVSMVFTNSTGISLPAIIGADEYWLVAGMIVFGLVAATLPAFLAYRYPVIESLRAG